MGTQCFFRKTMGPFSKFVKELGFQYEEEALTCGTDSYKPDKFCKPWLFRFFETANHKVGRYQRKKIR